MFGSKQSIFDTAVQFFKEDDWHFEKIEGKTALKMGFKGDNVTFRILAIAKDDKHRLEIFSVLDTNIPEDKRFIIAEYLTRANYGLDIGNFELDFSDGEVRYKSNIDIEGGQLTIKMVKTLVYANFLMMDRYYPGIMSVLYGNVSPEEAIKKIEGS